MASKQILNKFYNKKKPSSETSKSSGLSLMDQVYLQPNVVCNSSDKPFINQRTSLFLKNDSERKHSTNIANLNGLKIINGFTTM